MLSAIFCQKDKRLVVRKIKENQFLSILEDEAFDCSNQEQLSLVIRYVDSFRSPDKRY